MLRVFAHAALLFAVLGRPASQAAQGEPPVPDVDVVAIEVATPPNDHEETTSPPSLLAGAGGFTHVVPIVLSLKGLGGSFFTSELTFTNRSAAEAEVELVYTAAFGSGSGTVRDRIGPRAQKTVSDAISYLRSLGLPIPEGVDVGGTLRATFSGIAAPTDAAILARTTSPVPDGRAGLAYPGVVAGLSERALVCGLRQDAKDRSNLALINLGGPDEGPVTLRVTVYPTSRSQGFPKTLPVVTLPPGGFKQLSGVLGLAGFAAGWVTVDRQSGTVPYYAYGVINDQDSSDGSFIQPVLDSSTLGKRTLVIPVVVESGPFTSELVLTNTVGFDRNLTITLVADGVTAPGGAVTTSLALPGTSQIVIDGIVEWMRQRTAGIPPQGTVMAGALFISGATSSDWPSWVVASCRTSARGAVGRYGLFYNAVANGNALDDAGWIYGLRQDAENRTNLALVNTGESSTSGSDTFAIDVYDGRTGQLAGTLPGGTLGPRQWSQIPMVLTRLPFVVEDAFAKVRRTSGTNPFLAYAVINDGAGPGQRSGDGAFLGAQPDCVYPSPASPIVPGRSGGNYSSSVLLEPGCPWTASTRDAWITFPSTTSTSGTGNAFVSLTVARNDGATLRSGQVLVGGAKVDVIQTANAVSPYDGTWSGTTGQGRPISFRVEMGEITSLTLGMSISLSCGSAIGTYTQSFSNRVGVYQAQFGLTASLSSSGTGSPNTTLSATFGGTSQASGSFSVSSIRSGSTTCIVIGGKPGSTWTATKQ